MKVAIIADLHFRELKRAIWFSRNHSYDFLSVNLFLN